MKKLIMLLFTAVVPITSCSKDSETVAETPKVNNNLLSRIEGTITTEGSTNVVNSLNTLTYNGNKLVDIKSGTDISTYTYTGDLITKDTSTDTAEFSRTSVYTYDNNKLKSELETSNNTNNLGQVTVTRAKSLFIAQPDGTIVEENYTVSNTGVEIKESETVHTFTNNNLVKSVNTRTRIETNNSTGTPVITTFKSVQTETYEYDNKKNPFLNVTGFKNFLPETRSSNNNLLKETTKFENFTNNILDQFSGISSSKEYFFKYNTNDYPLDRTYTYITSVNNVISIKTAVSKYIYE